MANAAETPGWETIVATARLAPSPHNTQPWLVRPRSETDAELLYDPRRILPDTDPDGRFMTIAIGIFAEALDIAAREAGHTVECSYPGTRLDHGTTGPQPFAELQLAPIGGGVDLTAADLFRRRRTARLPYDGAPLTERSCEALSAVAAKAGHTAVFTSERDDVARVVRLNRDSLFYDLRVPYIRKEISHWIRRSKADALRQRDGFAPDCLGFPGLFIDQFFRRQYLFDLPLVRSAIEFGYGRQFRGTATVGWLSGPQETPFDWFETGRMFLRFWLAATAEGLSIHPFGSVITNPDAHARLVAEFAPEEPGRPVWLLFRIGRSKTPPRSARLRTEELLR